ncbi:MAG: DUF3592 domain-containing protein [Pirellulaceae bacterium]|nr:DUF3592 domain-containing protein [Planctomycetales bacterium]MCA9203428.1 DUF3592 domain-containing protein [Planctomycetales bacterium]
MVLAPAFLGWGFVAQVRLGLASAEWPSVQGEVLNSYVRYSHDRGLKRAGGTPEISYRYEVQGRTYENDMVTYVNDGYGNDWATQLVEAHPVGHLATVYFDPNGPHESVLIPGATSYGIFLAGFAFSMFLTVFLVAGGGCLWAARYWRKQASQLEAENNEVRRNSASESRDDSFLATGV